MFHTKQEIDRHVNEVFKNLKGESERNLKCYQIAKHYFKVGDYKSTIKFANRYLSTTTGSALAHRLLGEAYLGINAKMKALDAFKASLELDGNQRDLVLKVCELLCDPDIPVVAGRATYWLERAETLFPKDPVVFKLKEHLLKCGSDGKEDSGQLEKLILSEISARPADVTVRIRLLNFFLECKRYKIAYQYALELEIRNLFNNDLRWYDCLAKVIQAYESFESQLGFDFLVRKIAVLDRRTNLSMEEFQTEVKTLTECSSALFAFDQALHSFSKSQVPNSESVYFNELIKHFRAQLSFYLASLALKRAKKECGIWPKAERTAIPLLLQATQSTMDLEDAWYGMLYDKNKTDRDIKQWNKDAAFRISQAGHVLRALAHDKNHQFLDKVAQFCGGKWRGRVYQDIFYNREHQQALGTSYFMSDPSCAEVPLRLLTEAQLAHYDELSQSAYPDSLHHLVWLGLASFNEKDQLKSDFRCTIVPDLQFCVENLSNTGPETLNQLDVDAFLYAAVICAKAAAPSYISNDRPSRLPVSISEDLCSPAQADWWNAVYKTYTKQTTGNISEMRLKLRKGIETIRAFGHHGLHVKLIVSLAKLFQDRAANNKNSDELDGLEARTNLYWTAAIPLLEKIEKNQQLRIVPNRLFDYRGKELTSNEIKSYIEDGRLFLACRLMKQGRHEEAIEAFQLLKSPYATFYQALIYKKLASDEINHRPESITSENRSQHIILLTRARDALFLTLDRLRSPAVDASHPLNSQLHAHLEEVETQLARIDPDSNLNRNGDAESDDTDTAPGALSPDAVGENLDHSFNVYNANNFLTMTNQSTPRPVRNVYDQRHHTSRMEARPSPERLDAQLRHLIQAYSSGHQSVLDELRDMNSTLKDLKSIMKEGFGEFKKWREHSETATSKRAADDIKPEDLFEFPDDEDYEDLNQLAQQYGAYQNYPNYRQMTGVQGTSTVTYGAPVPPVPAAIPPMLQTPGAPLIPPSFFPNARGVQVDPNLLLYQTMGYYNPAGLPFSDGQNLPDFRAAGIQRGVAEAAAAAAAAGVPPAVQAKPQTPNVVITSSDTLPAYTNSAVPAMSVTIPPHHIKGVTPTKLNPNQNQVHAFQIPMPPQAQMVKESPSEKNPTGMLPVATTSILNYVPSPVISAVKPSPPRETQTAQDLSISATPVTSTKNDAKPKPDFKSIPQPGETEVKPSTQESKLFESRAKLYIFVKNEGKEGEYRCFNGEIRVLHNEKLGKARIVMLRDADFHVTVNHYVTPDMQLRPHNNNDRTWLWSAEDVFEGVKALRNYCVRFKTNDELRDFEYAFNRARDIAKESSAESLSLCVACGKTTESKNEKCNACQKEETDKMLAKPKLGGFTFNQSPIIKPPAFKPEEPPKTKPEETTKPSPFASFSFAPTTTSAGFVFKAPTTGSTKNTATTFSAPQTTPSTDTKAPGGLMFGNNVTVGDFSILAAKNSVADAFKQDSNFKGFEGAGTPVFGRMGTPKATNLTPQSTNKTPEGSSNKSVTFAGSASKQGEDEEGQGDASEFVPTAEFAPVIPLPDLVEVKTGEEGERILYEGRAKILRYDSETKQWKERGIGMMKLLLNETTAKVRLLMRREQVLKVCCNHFLDEKMEFKTMTTSDKALTWYAQDYSDGDLKPELLAIRFGKSESMLEFKKVIEETQKKLKNGRMMGINVAESPETKKEEQKPLSELFKSKPGSWECNMCYLRNDEGATKCMSCETPKPGSESKAESKNTSFNVKTMSLTETKNDGQKPLSELFKSKPGSWECGMCYLRNNEDAIKCVSCETPKPGFESKANESASSTKQEPKGIILDPSLATKFNFGIPQSMAAVSSSNTKSDAASIFGASAVKNSEPERQNFFFGVPPATSGSNFVFGTPSAPANKGNEDNKTGSESKPSAFVFGSSKEPEQKPSAFIFGTANAAAADNKTASPFSFNIKTDAKAPDFKIGSSGTFEFSFSGVKQQPVKSPGTVKSPGGGVTSGDDSEDEHPEEDDGEHITFKPLIPLPDKVPVRTGEEDETVLYVHRAKLYRFTDGEWKERGLGDVKILKHNQTNKVRLLMRREQVLKICLNHYLTKDMEFLAKDNKTWLWTAADFSEGVVSHDKFCIRFKTPEIAVEFKEALDKAQKELQVTPVKPSEPTEAMKNFTFAIPGSGTPKSSGSASGVSRNLFSNEEDVAIVYENQVTPEQREAALKLQLPPNFYSYLNAPKCPGCPGCSDDEDENKVQSDTEKKALVTEAPSSEAKPTFCWGSLTFDQNKAQDPPGFRFGGSNTFSFGNGTGTGTGNVQPFTRSTTEPVSAGADSTEDQEDGYEDYEDDVDDDGEEVDDEEDDDEDDFDIHDAEETLVLEKQNFVLHKFNDATGKYDVIGSEPTLQLFEMSDTYFRINIEENETGDVICESFFDPTVETMFKMSNLECMWVSMDQAIDPPAMKNILIRFSTEKDLEDFLKYFGENDPPEEILNSFRTSPASS